MDCERVTELLKLGDFSDGTVHASLYGSRGIRLAAQQVWRVDDGVCANIYVDGL